MNEKASYVPASPFRRRLAASDDFEELRLLARCDRNGREQGVQNLDLVEAIEYLRDLARTCGE